VLYGSVVAGGAQSDVVVTAEQSIDLRGSLTAGRNLNISAGSTVVPGTESIRTYGTSKLRSVHGGEIRIHGVNDVFINSTIGPGSGDISLIELASTSGSLQVARESGRIETGTQLNFIGHSVEIAGVVTSTRATPATDDYEISIDIAGTATLHGDLQLAGSMLVKAAAIDVYEQRLIVRGPNQKLRFESTADITFSRTADGPDGPEQQGAVISAPQLQILAGGTLTLNPGTVVYSPEAGVAMQIEAQSAVIAGSILAGADLDDAGLPVWIAPGEARLSVTGNLTFGGLGVNEAGQPTARGGTIRAVNAIRLTAGGTISQSPLSTLEVDATAWGARSAGIPSALQLTAGAALQLFGTVQSLDSGSDLQLQAAGQVLIGGLITAADQLQITAGEHGSETSLVVLPIELDSTGTQRLSGGEIRTGFGGSIMLQATDGVLLQGNVGSGQTAGDAFIADAFSITVSSTTGSIAIEGRLESASSLSLTAGDISVLTGARLRTSAPDATVRLNAADLLFVEAAGTDSGIAPAGTIQTAGLLHLRGTQAVVEGIVQSLAGRVLVSAVDGAQITGSISAGANIDIHAGVNPASSLAQLESAVLSKSDLTTADVQIRGAGALQASGSIQVLAGGDIDVQSSASAAPDDSQPPQSFHRAPDRLRGHWLHSSRPRHHYGSGGADCPRHSDTTGRYGRIPHRHRALHHGRPAVAGRVLQPAGGEQCEDP
jgi:hypothetical protein